MRLHNKPWVEKYRPESFEKIVLDDVKKTIFGNLISHKTHFPNLLFFGPPGTGKTTTIINMINVFNSETGAPLIIHLNASDDRGIDVIRANISQFVSANTLFKQGTKFIVLDEIDCMTRTAQLALKYLIEHTRVSHVRFCLICNYISKIDTSLVENFMVFRFNAQPQDKVFSFIQNILHSESVNVNEKKINDVISYFKSDMRSMINYIQLNKVGINESIKIEDVVAGLVKRATYTNKRKITFFKESALKLNVTNADLMKHIIEKQFLDYTTSDDITSAFLKKSSYVYHNLINGFDEALILLVYEIVTMCVNN